MSNVIIIIIKTENENDEYQDKQTTEARRSSVVSQTSSFYHVLTSTIPTDVCT